MNDSNRTIEQRYNDLLTVFDNLDPSFIMDRDGTILEANRSFAALFGKQAQECLNTNAFDLLPPKLAASRKIQVEKAWLTGQPLIVEDEQDGLVTRLRYKPISGHEGNITKLLVVGQDITEWQIAEKVSKRQQMVSRAILNSIPGAFLMLDAEGRFVQWNDHERDVVIGKPEGKMPSTVALEAIHRDDRELVEKKMMDILKNGTEESEEVRVLLHGGPVFRWHQLSGKRIIINDLPYLIGTATDITERKLADQAALKHCEDRFRTLFHEHSAVQLVIDAESANIIDANQAAADFYGWSITELRTMKISDINTTPFEKAIVEIENKRLSEKHPVIFKHYLKDGSLRDVEVFSKKINTNQSNQFYAIIHDITDRKLAEEQLEKMSVAVKQSPAAVIITNPLGNIEYVNPMFTKFTGYSAEDAIGQNPRFLQSGQMEKSVYDSLWSTILSGGIWQGEMHNKKKNGDLFWESSVITAIRNTDGVITNFVAVKEDITLQKNMLAELITAKEKAEESDRLKSSFLATITHELRTPMNGILGFAELLKDPELSQKDSAEYIDLIHHSGLRLLTLINELIDLARIEAGETIIKLSDTPVNTILNDLSAFFKLESNKKGLRLSFNPALPDHESIIVTDSVKLNQILTNLIQNALKFTIKGGIDFGYIRNDTVLKFYVKDSGIGIPLGMEEKIFERFIQVDNPLTRKMEGSGLGLSISRAYVEMLGGKIWVESEEGTGCTFYFTLPYNPLQ